MPKTELHLKVSENSMSTSELALRTQDWILDSKLSYLSTTTIEGRRLFVEKLLWFFNHHQHETCGPAELRQLFVYLREGHESPEGRWGNPRLRKPLRPVTVKTFYVQCRVLFNWMVGQDYIEESPLLRIKAPRALADQISPFSADQIENLLTAAQKSRHPKRDEAIIWMLYDTALRASELIGLRLCDIDMDTRACVVIGKGNKKRTVYFGRPATKALYKYLKEQPREANDALFTADRGTTAGEALTRSGLLQLIQRLGEKAGIELTRCSPHTFRHTFAVEFLRNGGHAFSLQQILGHSNLQMTNRYVLFADADIAQQHRQFAPSERLKRGKNALR